MLNQHISKIAIIGSGIMGSGIACHFANIGVQVLLLDIIPKSLNDIEKKKGLSLDDKIVRNRIVNESLNQIIKSKPAPLYHKSFKSRITTGNIEDDLHLIKDVNWIMEVVTERLDIKKVVFENIEKYRKPGTIITSNTSGIPINQMSEGRSNDFQKHFCGTHFFNPARYLKLFEIIPGPNTSNEIIEFLNNYGSKFLGKTSVIAKDTPTFIGNRIGIFGIQSIFHSVKDIGLTIEEIDKLTGPVIGRPKSATFRTADVVGLDTLVHVTNGLYENCKEDEERDSFKLTSFVNTLISKNWLGDKTKQGFYKKTVNKEGKREILVLDLETLEYRQQKKAKFATLELTKTIDKPIDRFPILINGKDKAGEFYKRHLGDLFSYVQNRIPEIADEIYKIDDALKAGFGWENGPFEIWNKIGLDKGIELIENQGKKVNDWVKELSKTHKKFYKTTNSKLHYYDLESKEYLVKPGQDAFIILDNIDKTKEVFKNSGATLKDIGDGILNLEFTSKMNTLGGDVLSAINKSIDIAEKDFRGLVIGNQSANFSVGANLGMIFMMAVEQDYDELHMAVKYFQDTTMRLRYSSIPTIAAPHGMTLGGGCELSMHCDKVIAAAETYMGLVEFGVGVIPGGGGSKEMALRASDLFKKGDIELNVLQENFLTIGMAKVSTSAHEAFDLGLLQKNKDIVSISKDRQIATAKSNAVLMSETGYTKPIKRKDIKVLGKQALGMFLVGTDAMQDSNYISEHDKKIANKLAYVMAGGDLSEPTYVDEQYLLDLEREAFMSLCTEKKTLERIQHMLTKGKPLRN